MSGGINYSVMDSKLKSNKNKGQNITVVVRCRPRNDFEKSIKSPTVVELNAEKREVTLTGDQSVLGHWGINRSFVFDRVFDHRSKQIEVYKSVVVPLLDEVLQGYCCTIFAYGQTGTGKTYTMEGNRNADRIHYSWEQDPQSGIIPRSIHQLFEMLDRFPNLSEFSVRVSFLEIYNEELFDLLGQPFEVQKLRIFEDNNRKGAVFVQGLEEVIVHNKNEVYSILEKGASRRQTSATLLNANSSRSHTVFSITVNMKESNIQGEDIIKTGRLYLVDLAGSENIGRSGAVDRRAREAGTINQSLLTLGRVIFALVEKTKHVPYRESKLTRLLQDSLGGRTKTVIIATISPSSYSIEETISTLEYAQRAKRIKNRPEVNQLNKKGLIKEYTETIDKLNKDLMAAREKNGIYLSDETYGNMQNLLASQKDNIIELEDQIVAVREQMLKLTNMFEENQVTLETHQKELNHAKKWLCWVKNEICIAQESIKHKSNLIKQKDAISRELIKQQQTLYSDATELSKLANEELNQIQTLNSKIDCIRKKGHDNQISIDGYSNYIKNTSLVINDMFCHAKKNSFSCVENFKKCSTEYLNNDKDTLDIYTKNCGDACQSALTDLNSCKGRVDELVKKSSSFLHETQNSSLCFHKSMSGNLTDLSANICASSTVAENFNACLKDEAQKFSSEVSDHFRSNSSYVNNQYLEISDNITKIEGSINSYCINKHLDIIKSCNIKYKDSFKEWKHDLLEQITKVVDTSFDAFLSGVTTQSKMVEDCISSISRESDTIKSKSVDLLNQIKIQFLKMREHIEKDFNATSSSIFIFLDLLNKNYSEYFQNVEKSQKEMKNIVNMVDEARNSHSQCITESCELLIDQMSKILVECQNYHLLVEQSTNCLKLSFFNQINTSSGNSRSLVDALTICFDKYQSLNEDLSLNFVNIFNNIGEVYKNNVSSRSFESYPVGDTPNINDLKIRNITTPRTFDEIANTIRCQELDNMNTPTPPRKRKALGKLNTINDDKPIPSFCIDPNDTSKSIIDKENTNDLQ